MKQTSHPPHLLRALGVLAPLTLALAGCAEAPDSSSPEHSAEAKQNLTTCVTLQRGPGTSVVDDVRITQSQPTTNLNNQALMIDKFSKALIKFTLPALPQSAVLNSATMTLYPTVAGGGPINIHAVLQPWSETGVTFASFNQKFAPAIAAVFAPTASATLKSVDITALAQTWISGAQANNGLLLETTSTVATYIMPSEAGVNSLGVDNSGLRPSLKLCYTTPTNNCAPNPCQNGASCQNLANGFTCACPPGFTGATCQTNIDDCAGNPCQNGGACTDGLNSYTCACPPGFAGANCQTNINECAPAPCQNGGVCTDGINSYTCACPAGYTGQNCQTLINNCASAPCQNGGSCTNGVSSYSCACATGFSGQNCQVNIDDCVGNACKNGSTCIDGIAAYTCSCPPGYNGNLCQINIDDCAGAPCLNGGSCNDGIFSYSCSCAAGYTGTNCQIDINDCAGNPCQNGGMCVDGVNSYACQCPSGWSGTNCQTAVVCPTGWTGPGCGVDIDECAGGDPCNINVPDPVIGYQQGLTCTNTPGGYTCQCSSLTAGAACDVPCPCLDTAALAGDLGTVYPWYFFVTGSAQADSCVTIPSNTTISAGGQVSLTLTASSCSAQLTNGGTPPGPDYALTSQQHAACQRIFDFIVASDNLTCGADHCAPNLCQHGGTCTNGALSYTCHCAPGYSGTQCEIDLCQPNPCQNGGTCSAPQGTATCACPPGFSGTQCEVSIVPMDFGGMWGTIEGALQVNPATGAASCPAGYTATAVRGTPGYDYDASYCWRGSVAGQDPLYDFGGMWGYVNNQLAPNKLTYAAACPAGYTDLEVAEASGSDYPLHVCYKAHQAGTPARRFGGMYGVVNDAPANNPATGASTCPPGYTANQVLGSSGIDHPMYYCDEVCPVGFVGLQCEIPVAPMEFGGMWGVVEGQLQNNPATGAPSCPAGYTTTTLFDNPGLDNPAYYCWRGHVAGQEALYDFGGMWGYVNNQLVENPVTAASSCPAGYTTQQVSGSSGDDYSLYLCYQPHVPGVTGPLLGGLFGTIHGFPGANPATSASSCPAGYTASQVLGTPGIDGPVSFCYQACPAGFVGAHCEIAIVGCNTAPCQNGSACTDVSSGHTCACLPGFIGSNCEIPVLPMQFGGMWGFVEGVEQANPATGTSSCPAGYTTTTILDNPGLDYAAHYCWRGVVAGQTPLYDFGGMWGYVNNQLVMNAVTGTPACPAGYTAQRVNGSSGSDYSFFVCYQPHVAGTTGPLLGGLLGSVNGVPQNNPATGAASCPPGYTQSQVLGTQGIDSAVSYCYQP